MPVELLEFLLQFLLVEFVAFLNVVHFGFHDFNEVGSHLFDHLSLRIHYIFSVLFDEFLHLFLNLFLVCFPLAFQLIFLLLHPIFVLFDSLLQLQLRLYCGFLNQLLLASNVQ